MTPQQHPSTSGITKQCIIMLHGLGADGHDLITLAPYFAEHLPDAHFVAPNAPHPCDIAPTGYQWFSSLNPDLKAIYHGVDMAKPHLEHIITEQKEKLTLEDKDIYLLGFSQGSMVSLHTALTREKTLGGVLSYSGALLGIEHLEQNKRSTPPICLIHGEMDEVIPIDIFKHSSNALTEHNIAHQAHAYKELGHSINTEGLEVGRQFLADNIRKQMMG